MKDRNMDPELVVGTVLEDWTRSRYESLPRSGLRESAKLARDPSIRALTELLEEQDLLTGAYWLSSTYAVLSEESYRKSMAMYFTPPGLTLRLLDDLEGMGVDFAARTFCDPACGGAAFLAPIASRMRLVLKRRGVPPREILTRMTSQLSGVDKDRVLCELSRHFLLMVLYEDILAARATPAFQIEHGDSFQLLADRGGTLDVIVSNPPFRKMSAEEAGSYRGAVGEVLQGQPNIYGLFMAMSVKLLRPRGVCALVTPTSFLSGEYFGRLRGFLRDNSTIAAVSVLSDRDGVFLGVQQETAITVLEKPKAGTKPLPEAAISVVDREGVRVPLGSTRLPEGSLAWPIPRIETDAELIRRVSLLKHRIVDYGYRARIGGFVWNRDCHETYATLADVPKGRRARIVPLLWSSDIDAATGRIKFGRAKRRVEPRYVDMGCREHSYIVRSPCVLLQRVTSNDQPRRLVPAAITKSFLKKHKGFVGENHLVILERVDSHSPFSPHDMVSLMTCPAIERFFRCISGSTNVSVFELGQIPLPDPKSLLALVAQKVDLQAAAERLLAEPMTSGTTQPGK